MKLFKKKKKKEGFYINNRERKIQYYDGKKWFGFWRSSYVDNFISKCGEGGINGELIKGESLKSNKQLVDVFEKILYFYPELTNNETTLIKKL